MRTATLNKRFEFKRLQSSQERKHNSPLVALPYVALLYPIWKLTLPLYLAHRLKYLLHEFIQLLVRVQN